MSVAIDSILKNQLIDRRHKLEDAIMQVGEERELSRLLQEVDSALERMDHGQFGICEVCHDPIETERLIADPLAQFCLDHLTPYQQKMLQKDLDLAASIQKSFLPKLEAKVANWQACYKYEALGPVSGDYCDLISVDNGDYYFIVGDVSGKGVAASMLMAQLHAMFRTLISVNLPFDQLVEQASRIFCESTMPMHFATLVCGKATRAGEVEICNAGHLPPLFLHAGEVTKIEATGLPIGMFCNEKFTASKLTMKPGDALVLYTDGLSEAVNSEGEEYGVERLATLVCSGETTTAQDLIDIITNDLMRYRAGEAMNDDLTIMAIQRRE